MIKLLRKFLDVGSETGVAGMRSRVDIDPKAFSAIYAVGDVHGCYAELLEAECRILHDAGSIDGPKLIVMLGDYVDRGPSSRRVIDHLMAPLAPGFERVSLCGNHDDVFCHFLDDPSAGRRWLDLARRPRFIPMASISITLCTRPAVSRGSPLNWHGPFLKAIIPG